MCAAIEREIINAARQKSSGVSGRLMFTLLEGCELMNASLRRFAAMPMSTRP